MNTPVSFELAKLLKEKEIYIPAFHYYENEVLKEPYLENGSSTDTEFRVELSDLKEYFNKWSKKISAPTIAEVVMWLYEKYGIWIAVNRVVIGSDEWDYDYIISYLPREYEFEKRRSNHLVEIQSFKEGVGSYHGAWYTPTEAYEAAIKYTLENLIQGGNNEQQ